MRALAAALVALAAAGCSSKASPVDAGRADAPVLTSDGPAPPRGDAPRPDHARGDTSSFVPVPGVHTPLPIDPTVSIPDNHWLLDAYRVVFDREHDPTGYRVNRKALEAGFTRAQLVAALVASAEFTGKPALADRSGFVGRLYEVLLKRSPSAAEVSSQLGNLRNAAGSGTGLTWAQMVEAFYASPEYKAVNCHTSYYTLGAAVSPSALLLRDLFDGKARLQTIGESEAITLKVPDALAIWDQKLPVLKDPSPQATGYLAFTRAYVQKSPDAFNVVLLTSTDAVTFTEVGPVFDRSGNQTFYDPHLAEDGGVCPRRWVMATECLGHEGAASLCTSQSTTPGWAETWSAPHVLVDGCGGNAAGICKTAAAESASTGTTLVDGKTRYVAWTQVYDGVGANDPLAHTYSQAALSPAFDGYFGTVMQGSSPIVTMLSAEPEPWCTSSWDCNNRDKQDWKREGGFYYALYNGANYYRCDGTWGVSVARSASPAGGEYTDRLPLARGIKAERNDTCGISYPVLNVIGGELYVYYAYYPSNPALGANRTMRARLLPFP
jgi:hypothetical protein